MHQVQLEVQNEELRRAQVELDVARSRYFDLYDLAPVGYCTLSPIGVVLQANLTAATMLGLTRTQVLGRAFSRFVHVEHQGALHRLLQPDEGLDERRSADVRMVKEHGGDFWAQLVVSASQSEAGAPECRVVLNDVTARKEAEAARREGELRYKELFSRGSCGILLFADDGEVIEVNESFARMHGFTVAEAARLNVSAFDSGRVALEPNRRHRMAAGEQLTFELEHLHCKGHTFPVEAVVSQVVVGGKRSLLGFYRDTSERRRLHARLAQREQLASMGLLAAGVAHEINNPLAYVLSNLESLTHELPSVTSHPAVLEDLVERARAALDGVVRITAISRSLAGFAGVERTELQSVDLNHAMEHAALMANSQLKYRARLVADLKTVPRVRAVEGRLTQVFLNLLINAAHAIDEGHAEENTITMRSWASAGDVFAEIADTGTGIPREQLARIFEPFFTTKAVGVGSGLGLSICRTIMTELGGDLTVDSELGKGSRFLVRLPAEVTALEPHPSSPRPPEAPAPVTPRGRILVVDDEKPIRSVIGRLLGKQHDIVGVGSGLEAKVLLEQDPGFDVILCDLMMPQMTGMDLHEWLVGHDLSLSRRLVFMSGGAFTPRATAYLESVDNLELRKPFDAKALMKLVATMVTSSARRGLS